LPSTYSFLLYQFKGCLKAIYSYFRTSLDHCFI